MSNGAKKKWYQSLSGNDVRRLTTALTGGLLLAVMTGPAGSITQPLSGLKDSILSGHVVGYAVFGLIIGTLMTYRAKVREGEWGRRGSERKTVYQRFLALRESYRNGFFFVTAVLGFFATLLIADFTGPYAANKFSIHAMLHQFVLTRTYGYLVLAFLIWVAFMNQLYRFTKFKLRSVPAPLLIVASIISGLFFALTSDPFLPARFALHSLSVSNKDSLFHHWTTYLWTGAALYGAGLSLFKRRAPRDKSARVGNRSINVASSTRILLNLSAVFIAFEAPKFLSTYWQISMYQQIGIYALLALGLNIVVGFAGLLDLGYVAFYALGAYITAYFSGALPLQPPFHLNPFLVIPIAVVVAMLSGVLLGLPTLRLRGDYLAIVTLGFGEIIYVLANDWTSTTGGSPGTGNITGLSVNFLGIHYTWSAANPLSYYYLMLAILIPVILIFDYLNNSRVGRTWAAIREDEVAAQSLGINALKYKVMAFAMGASTAGVAGVFTAVKVGVLFPNTFVLQLSITILVLVIFGGMGSIVGVLGGAIFLQWVPSYLTFHSYFGYEQTDLYLYIGALLVIMMIFRPQGLLPSVRRRREFRDAEAGLGDADALGSLTQEQPQ